MEEKQYIVLSQSLVGLGEEGRVLEQWLNEVSAQHPNYEIVSVLLSERTPLKFTLGTPHQAVLRLKSNGDNA